MSPGGHLITTALACGAAYGVTGSASLTAGLAAGGFLIDVDHAVDYVCFERRRSLSPGAFLRYYLEGRARRHVLVLHSWELLALLAFAAFGMRSALLWGYVLGMALHLPLDVIYNGRLATNSLVPFYSFVYRCRRRFVGAELVEQKPLARLREGFWVVFFRGSRLRNPLIHAVRRPTLCERVLRRPAAPTTGRREAR